MKRFFILVLFVFPLSLPAGTCKLPEPCQPGDKVNVTSNSLDTTKFNVTRDVLLVPATGGATSVTAYLLRDSSDPHAISFVIPEETADGSYRIQVTGTPKVNQATANTVVTDQTAKPVSVDDIFPGQIIVQSPKITAVSPDAAFLGDDHNHKITILGSGFRASATSIRFLNLATPPQCAKESTTAEKKQCYDLFFDSERQIRLIFHPLDRSAGYYDGSQDFVVVVDGLETKKSHFSLVDTGENAPRNVALIGLALMVGLVLLLVRAGKSIITQTFGNKDYVLSAFFLDPRTSSYSLSKCQFYAWTAAAVLGYLFLAVSKSYVQGNATFPDIPSGLPGILLASVGTMVLSDGIATTKGDKGAGNPEPNLSDFIATGGVVAADRVQFAVWTVVGVSTFLAIVFQSDPRNINDLPSIPSGFLQLMGISSAGYLAGKLARKAGPTLDDLAISGTPDKFTFQLTGSALSRSAMFAIDDAPIYPDTIQGADPSSKLPDIIQLDPTVNDPDFARILRFTITQPNASWIGGTTQHNFTVTNPDKQKATLPFQIFKLNDIKIVASANSLEISGEFLDNNLKVRYTKPGGQPTDVTNAVSASSHDYKATVEAGLTGQLTVMVADTSGFVVTRTVTVVP